MIYVYIYISINILILLAPFGSSIHRVDACRGISGPVGSGARRSCHTRALHVHSSIFCFLVWGGGALSPWPLVWLVTHVRFSLSLSLSLALLQFLPLLATYAKHERHQLFVCARPLCIQAVTHSQEYERLESGLGYRSQESLEEFIQDSSYPLP